MFTMKIGLATILFFSVPQAICQGLDKDKPTPIPPNIALQTKWDWTNDKWTGDDRPYVAARRQIDQAYAAGKSPEPLIQKYRVATEKGPRIHTASSIFYNPLACYRWGYAAWKTVSAKSSLKEQGKHLSGVSEALASASSPHIYEYTRLRFFVEAWYIPSSKLKNVGLRLLKHSPGDLDVKYHMTRILTQIVTAQNNRLALSYAKDLVHSRPQRPHHMRLLVGSTTIRGNFSAIRLTLLRLSRLTSIAL